MDVSTRLLDCVFNGLEWYCPRWRTTVPVTLVIAVAITGLIWWLSGYDAEEFSGTLMVIGSALYATYASRFALWNTKRRQRTHSQKWTGFQVAGLMTILWIVAIIIELLLTNGLILNEKNQLVLPHFSATGILPCLIQWMVAGLEHMEVEEDRKQEAELRERLERRKIVIPPGTWLKREEFKLGGSERLNAWFAEVRPAVLHMECRDGDVTIYYDQAATPSPKELRARHWYLPAYSDRGIRLRAERLGTVRTEALIAKRDIEAERAQLQAPLDAWMKTVKVYQEFRKVRQDLENSGSCWGSIKSQLTAHESILVIYEKPEMTDEQ